MFGLSERFFLFHKLQVVGLSVAAFHDFHSGHPTFAFPARAAAADTLEISDRQRKEDCDLSISMQGLDQEMQVVLSCIML